MGVIVMVIVIGGLAAMMSTPEQRAEADARWNRIGKIIFIPTVIMVAVWIYMG